MEKRNYLFALFLGVSVFGQLSFAQSLDEWIAQAEKTAVAKLHVAISPASSSKGAVYASPSRSQPDYYYHWVRDASIAMLELYYRRSQDSVWVDKSLREFIDFSRKNQLTVNPSGGPGDFGLGEPKFLMDGNAFEGPWGRPQNDGPALRAFLIARYAQDLLKEGNASFVANNIYRAELPAQTQLKADLEYVAHHWRDLSFDIWEESLGDHFYTRMVSWRALEEGAKLARLCHDENAAGFYDAQADASLRSLLAFWSGTGRIIKATVNQNSGIDYKGSGLDVAVLLAVLHVGKDKGPFSVGDIRVVNTAWRIEERFAKAFFINGVSSNAQGEALAPAIGRYPEDRYDGYQTQRLGSPWFLATLAFAEYYYRLAALEQSVKLRSSLLELGDQFMRRVRFHSTNLGLMSEQFDRDTGLLRGAEDLTWSYASLLSAERARGRVLKMAELGDQTPLP